MQQSLRWLHSVIEEGDLKGAFLRAHTMQARLESLKERINDLQYTRDEPR